MVLLAGINCLSARAQPAHFSLTLTGGTVRCLGGSYEGFTGAGTWGAHASGKAQFTFNRGLVVGISTEVSQLGFEGYAPKYPGEKAFLANPLYGMGLYIGHSEPIGQKVQLTYFLSVGGALVGKSTLLGRDETRGAAFTGGDLLYEYRIGNNFSLIGNGGLRCYWLKSGSQNLYNSHIKNYFAFSFPLGIGVKYTL